MFSGVFRHSAPCLHAIHWPFQRLLSCLNPMLPSIYKKLLLHYHCQRSHIAVLTQVAPLLSNASEMGRGTVLTGANDALRLTAWHKLDSQAARATLQFEAFNQLGIQLEGVTIKSASISGHVKPRAVDILRAGKRGAYCGSCHLALRRSCNLMHRVRPCIHYGFSKSDDLLDQARSRWADGPRS